MGLVNEREPLLVANLETPNASGRAEPALVEYGFVDFVTDIVRAPVNEQDLESFILLIGYDIIVLISPELKSIHQLNHERTVEF